MIELKRGNAEGARDLLTKALPQQPGNADGQVYLGRALQALNDDNAAMQHYREALNSNPDLYDAQMAVGSIYEKHQQPKEAILFYLKAAQLNPQQIEPLQALARVYEAVGMNAEASKIKAEIQRREAPSQNRSR
jgi:Tfp pilus assembly protein PilF